MSLVEPRRSCPRLTSGTSGKCSQHDQDDWPPPQWGQDGPNQKGRLNQGISVSATSSEALFSKARTLEASSHSRYPDLVLGQLQWEELLRESEQSKERFEEICESQKAISEPLGDWWHSESGQHKAIVNEWLEPFLCGIQVPKPQFARVEDFVILYHLLSAIDRAQLNPPIILYRGMRSGPEGDSKQYLDSLVEQAEAGVIAKMGAYRSSSACVEKAAAFAGGRANQRELAECPSVILRIATDHAKAVSIGHFTGEYLNLFKEYDFLVPQDGFYKVLDNRVILDNGNLEEQRERGYYRLITMKFVTHQSLELGLKEFLDAAGFSSEPIRCDWKRYRESIGGRNLRLLSHIYKTAGLPLGQATGSIFAPSEEAE